MKRMGDVQCNTHSAILSSLMFFTAHDLPRQFPVLLLGRGSIGWHSHCGVLSKPTKALCWMF